MKKGLWAWVALGLALWLGAGCAGADVLEATGDGAQRYVHEGAGFALTLPGDWRVLGREVPLGRLAREEWKAWLGMDDAGVEQLRAAADLSAYCVGADGDVAGMVQVQAAGPGETGLSGEALAAYFDSDAFLLDAAAEVGVLVEMGLARWTVTPRREAVGAVQVAYMAAELAERADEAAADGIAWRPVVSASFVRGGYLVAVQCMGWDGMDAAEALVRGILEGLVWVEGAVRV